MGLEIISFIDTYSNKNNPDFGSFTREFPKSNKIINFVDNQIESMTVPKKVRFIKKPKPKLITMDIETQVLSIENKNIDFPTHIPICICTYDGYKLRNFYITDFPNSDKLIETALKSIMIPKYSGYIVEIHNFSYFDGILLFRNLTTLGYKVESIQRDGRLIDTKIKFGKKYWINFRDSYLLLPSSLESLSISFNIENKGIFSLKILNDPNFPLNYIGQVPKNLKYYYVPDAIMEPEK